MQGKSGKVPFTGWTPHRRTTGSQTAIHASVPYTSKMDSQQQYIHTPQKICHQKITIKEVHQNQEAIGRD
jgi:hypothetical protein